MKLFSQLVLVAVFLSLTSQAAAEPFELKDGDKVVWLGSTLIEREQRYGYWETALTARWPDRNITFRNLGWSGDNVYGEARLAFDITKPELGLKRMVDLTLAEKPTVIFICYGTNESFEGEAGLAKFEKGYEKLLDELKPAKARIVLMTPTPYFESRKGSENSFSEREAKKRNKRLAEYCSVIERISARRDARLLDLFWEWIDRHYLKTENGVHLTDEGYFQVLDYSIRQELEIEVKWGSPLGFVDLSDGKITADGAKATLISKSPFKVDVKLNSLPIRKPDTFRTIISDFDNDLKGKILRIDEKDVPTERTTYGFAVQTCPDDEQFEQLRQAIIEKNQLYFYRWRPQNETYLFGFRKHEQGRNAKEVAEFDPLIAAKEKEIARLRVPKTHRYEIVPVEKK